MTPSPKVLVFCLPGIGDTLLAIPALRELKRLWPESHLTTLSMFVGARQLLDIAKCSDENLYFPFLSSSLVSSLRFVRSLRKRRFDITILSYPSNRWEYNLLALLSGSSLRAGHRYRHYDLRCGNWLNQRWLYERDDAGNMEENLRLISLVTGEDTELEPVTLTLPAQYEQEATQWLTDRPVDTSLLVGIHAGGSTAKNHLHKRWPPERFIQLAKRLNAELDATLLLFGGPSEFELNQQIASGAGPNVAVVSSQEMSLTAALIARCQHFISNDTALLHLAGALAIPSTGIFGPTNPEWVRMPGSPRTEVTLGLECQPCFHYSPRHLHCRFGDFRCLKQLEVDQVFNAARVALSNTVTASPQHLGIGVKNGDEAKSGAKQEQGGYQPNSVTRTITGVAEQPEL